MKPDYADPLVQRLLGDDPAKGGEMDTTDEALKAANRIMHGEGNENDVQLVAGVLFQILTSPRWRSEWRTGDEWARLP